MGGVCTGQYMYSGRTAPLYVGNILPVGTMPEGTLICNMESIPGDGGKYIRASGAVGAIVAQTTSGKTVIRLPSGQKKIVKGTCRAMVGVIAGGGRPEKPMLKAGRAYHKYKVKRNCWPKVSGVCMTPLSIPMEEVTINMSVSQPLSEGTERREGKWDSSLPEGLEEEEIEQRETSKCTETTQTTFFLMVLYCVVIMRY